MDAVILFSHGSLLCGAGEARDTHAEGLHNSGKWPIIEVGYMNYSEPTFLSAVRSCVDHHATAITVVPYFFIPGYFVKTRLPQRIAQAQELFPDLVFQIAHALGYAVRLADAILESAATPIGPNGWRDDLARVMPGTPESLMVAA
jgi:sirohydrochlorin ferrochelatase